MERLICILLGCVIGWILGTKLGNFIVKEWNKK